MERLFRSLKTEWMPTTGYRSVNEAKQAITDYLVGYYSQVRPHSYNGGLTPNESERLFWLEHKTVANFFLTTTTLDWRNACHGEHAKQLFLNHVEPEIFRYAGLLTSPSIGEIFLD